jgi:hypothetical protein
MCMHNRIHELHNLVLNLLALNMHVLKADPK